MAFSKWLMMHPYAKGEKALDRIALAMARLPNILERETVANQRTLEQKISDQGPNHQRVDPHLLGLAILELANERKIIRAHTHPGTPVKWYANARFSNDEVEQKLAVVGPLYVQVTTGHFPNLVGDALEVIVFKALQQLNDERPRYSFDGSFDLAAPKNKERYLKVEPQQTVSGHKTTKRADFILHGFDTGPLCIECKNFRQWLYPHEPLIKELILKAIEMNATPLLVARRIHYTTITNLLIPAGIIAHETYHQYYPGDRADIAEQVKHKRSLGFTDVQALETPEPRTLTFFTRTLLKVADQAAEKFRQKKEPLLAYANGEINLAQLYNYIDSPARGNWQDPEPEEY